MQFAKGLVMVITAYVPTTAIYTSIILVLLCVAFSPLRSHIVETQKMNKSNRDTIPNF